MKAKIEIPKGWRLVRRGQSAEGDLYFFPSRHGGGRWVAVNGITDRIGIPVTNFIFVIRLKK